MSDMKCSDCEKPIDKLRRVEAWFESGMANSTKRTLLASTTLATAAYAVAAMESVINGWRDTIWPWNHPGAVLLSIAVWSIVFTLGILP